MTEIKRPPAHVLASVLFAVLLFLFILSFSIGLPIYCRPFYYLHIEPMELSELSGFSKAEIKDAYNELLDYLTLPGQEFGTGAMNFSEDGAAHFADCKVLFDLNAAVLLGSGVCLSVLLILKKLKKLGEFHIGPLPSAFYSAVTAVLVPAVVGCLAAIDFDRAFVIFHSIFFPGKENWIIDWRTDEIILVLPENFFMHCAILIGISVLLFSAILITVSLVEFSHKKRLEQ